MASDQSQQHIGPAYTGLGVAVKHLAKCEKEYGREHAAIYAGGFISGIVSYLICALGAHGAYDVLQQAADNIAAMIIDSDPNSHH